MAVPVSPGGSVRVPADQVRLVLRGRGQAPLAVEVQVHQRGVDADVGDDEAGRAGAGQGAGPAGRLADFPARAGWGDGEGGGGAGVLAVPVPAVAGTAGAGVVRGVPRGCRQADRPREGGSRRPPRRHRLRCRRLGPRRPRRSPKRSYRLRAARGRTGRRPPPARRSVRPSSPGGRRAGDTRACVFYAPCVRRRSRNHITPPTAARPTMPAPATVVKASPRAMPPPPAGGPPCGPGGGVVIEVRQSTEKVFCRSPPVMPVNVHVSWYCPSGRFRSSVWPMPPRG